MHVLAATSGVIDGAAEAIDLKQSPADIVILSAADSELACLAFAHDTLPEGAPTLRLASLLQLQHNYSVDLYTDKTIASAKLVIVRLLGGKSYWPYGIERLRELTSQNGLKLALLPGGNAQDPELQSLSTISPYDWENLRNYFATGGPENFRSALLYCNHILGFGEKPDEAKSFATCGSLFPSLEGRGHPLFPSLEGRGQGWVPATSSGSATIIFYRSVIEGGLTAPITALAAQLSDHGVSAHAIYIASLKDKASQDYLRTHFATHKPSVIINATAFAVGDPENDVLAAQDCPVLQVTLAGSSEDQWRESKSGLSAKDLAMSVVLPELDGRIYAGAISFKADQLWHEPTQCRIVTYKPVQDRIARVAKLAANWAALRAIPNPEKRIAVILANYPNKEGRIANGVGYDTPASTINIMKALASSGYDAGEIPSNGNALIEALQANRKASKITLPLAEYESLFKTLPGEVQNQVEVRWGSAANDPNTKHSAISLPFIRYGNVVIGIQPSRGYNIDPKETYHDPALVPPHNYIAAYLWLAHHFTTHAIIHNGKHGNLEWLPGKSVALSESCFPDAVLAPIPHLYPFIVNDPGEGTAAKRRASAVIIDHLTPPLTRAETYGPLKDLEALVDEYYLASGLDRRRIELLKEKILDLTRHHKLDRDAGFTGDEDADLQKLDTFLCDLKEAQIRDGLHILGESPTGQQETDLLVALARVPNADGQSLIRALAERYDLGFDPLNCEMAMTWKGAKPEELVELSTDPWRTHGDSVERLELLAAKLVAETSSGRWPPSPLRGEGNAAASPLTVIDRDGTPVPSPRSGEGAQRADEVLSYITSTLRPMLRSCGPNEIANLLRGLEGRSVPPGPSGAPTRGRHDVLPTGRNFYSIDNRTLPTPAAFQLGKTSAQALLDRHFQDTGQHLKTAALSCWGTANMRTGGDDIAQALWLMGVKPVWDTASWRVTGFEVQPLAAVGRPRVDVTLRISGLFRDAFPAQIELLDKAIKAVAALEEDADDNPLAASLTTARIFGAKPGAYGAGLQALIDEGIWESRADLASAFVTWGAYIYGAGIEGVNDEHAFSDRLAKIEAVIHNQDNREHDLLDSDDYYQFEGGLSAAIETASGKKPRAYHNDHSRPERPVIRTLDEEVARVMRSRVVNPKWIKGVKRHGYKGAFEIAATVDYMFAFAATADAVKSHHFDMAYDAYLDDDETRDFIAKNNPAALREIAARFDEAITRGLWQPMKNSVHNRLKELAA
jgi:cobaltochelatase CobN